MLEGRPRCKAELGGGGAEVCAQRAGAFSQAFTSSWMTSLRLTASLRARAEGPGLRRAAGVGNASSERPVPGGGRAVTRSWAGAERGFIRTGRRFGVKRFTSSWMTSLGLRPRCAPGPKARACGGQPGSIWRRRSGWSCEGGAQRMRRFRRAFTSSWMTSFGLTPSLRALGPGRGPGPRACRRATVVDLAKAERLELRGRSAAYETLSPCVHVKLDDFVRLRFASPHCAPGPKARACSGQPGSIWRRRSGWSCEGGAQRMRRFRRAFTSSWMTTLGFALASRLALCLTARARPKASRLRRATVVDLAEAERREL